MRDGRRSPVRGSLVTPPTPRLFDQATAAAYLGLSDRAFEIGWRSRDLPEPVRIGRRNVWDRKLLDEWADAISGLGVEVNDFED